MTCIACDNLLLGYLSLLTSELAHLYDNCDEKHLHNLANVLISCLCKNDPETSFMQQDAVVSTRSESILTIEQVIHRFLGSECFMEMKQLQTTILSCCLKKIQLKK